MKVFCQILLLAAFAGLGLGLAVWIIVATDCSMTGSQFSPQWSARNARPDDRCVTSSQTESTRSAEVISQIGPSPDDPQSVIVPQRGSIAAFLTSLRTEIQVGDNADRPAPPLGNCGPAACKPGTRPADAAPFRGLKPRIEGQPAGVEIWENPLRKAAGCDFGNLFTRVGQRNLVAEKKAEGTIHRDIDSWEAAPMPNPTPISTAAPAPSVAGATKVRPLPDLSKTTLSPHVEAGVQAATPTKLVANTAAAATSADTTHFNSATKDPSVQFCGGWAVATGDPGATAKNYADAAVFFENGGSAGFVIPCTFGSEPAVGQYNFGWEAPSRP